MPNAQVMQPEELRAVEERAEEKTEPIAILRLVDPIMQGRPRYTPHMEMVVNAAETIDHRMSRMLGDPQVSRVVDARRGSSAVSPEEHREGYTVMAQIGGTWCYFDHGAQPPLTPESHHTTMAGSSNAKAVRLNMIDGCPRRAYREGFTDSLPTFDMYYAFAEDGPANLPNNEKKRRPEKATGDMEEEVKGDDQSHRSGETRSSKSPRKF